MEKCAASRCTVSARHVSNTTLFISDQCETLSKQIRQFCKSSTSPASCRLSLLIVVPRCLFYRQQSDSLSAPNATRSGIRFPIDCLLLSVQTSALDASVITLLFFSGKPLRGVQPVRNTSKSSAFSSCSVVTNKSVGAQCFPAQEETARVDVSEALKSRQPVRWDWRSP